MARGRKTGGRQKGTKNRRTQALEAASKAALAGLPTDFTSLMLMQAIYRDDGMPMPARLAAAKEALPYEHPKLASTELTGKDGGPIEQRSTVEMVVVDDKG